MITTYDVRWACDVLRPVYDATNGVDGRVSIEVDPRLAKDTAKTIAEAKQLWWLVDRPNVFIKIPATEAGLPAITATLAQGISVNVTLIFSLERYGEVMDAFLAGLEQAKANGHDLSKIGSVASFFVSRVDTEVDKRLDKIGTPEATALHGKAAIANARLAYELYESKFADRPLAGAGRGQGANVQRPLWASTSTKDPTYPDTMYVGRAGRAGHGEHHAGGDDPRDRRPRRAARRHGARDLRPVARRSSPTWRRSASATTTWCRSRGRGRREVRGVLERAARHDQNRTWGSE